MREERIIKDEAYREDKRVFLQLLQEPISRMSSTSAIFKGFSAAVLAGVASASFTDVSVWALLLGLIPIVAFMCLDIYYFRIEKKLRHRYNQIAKEEVPMDFIIHLDFKPEEIRAAKADIFRCMLSPAVWMFYGPVLICSCVLLILKARMIL